MRRFTAWLPLEEKSQTSYGFIDNEEWIDKEVSRLNDEYINESHGDVLFFKRVQQFKGVLCGIIMTKLPDRPGEEALRDKNWSLR